MLPALMLVLAQTLSDPGATPVTASPDQGASTPGAPSTLAALDTDRDGSVSRAEAVANPALSIQFPDLDANGDEALAPREFARFEAATPAPQAPRRSLKLKR